MFKNFVDQVRNKKPLSSAGKPMNYIANFRGGLMTSCTFLHNFCFLQIWTHILGLETDWTENKRARSCGDLSGMSNIGKLKFHRWNGESGDSNIYKVQNWQVSELLCVNTTLILIHYPFELSVCVVVRRLLWCFGVIFLLRCVLLCYGSRPEPNRGKRTRWLLILIVIRTTVYHRHRHNNIFLTQKMQGHGHAILQKKRSMVFF